MAFDGNGNFIRSYSWVSDATNNINISAPEMDTEDNGFATGLTLCVTRDGQGKMAADFLPSLASTYNVGTVSVPWLAGNFGSLNVANVASIGTGVVGAPTGGNKGAGTLNAIGVYAQGGVVSLFSASVVQSSTTTHGVAPATNDAVFTVALPAAGTYQFRLDAAVSGIGLGGGNATYNINYSAGFSSGEFAGLGIFAGTSNTNSGFSISTTAAGSTTNVAGGNPGPSGSTGGGSIIGTITTTAAGTLSLGWFGTGGANGTSVGPGVFTVNRVA